MSSEDDAAAPVNVYGETKLAAEQAIQTAWPRHVILRSSIIYGPQTPHPVDRALFVQFVVRAVSTSLLRMADCLCISLLRLNET